MALANLRDQGQLITMANARQRKRPVLLAENRPYSANKALDDQPVF
jgi:hypothetical protein